MFSPRQSISGFGILIPSLLSPSPSPHPPPPYDADADESAAAASATSSGPPAASSDAETAPTPAASRFRYRVRGKPAAAGLSSARPTPVAGKLRPASPDALPALQVPLELAPRRRRPSHHLATPSRSPSPDGYYSDDSYSHWARRRSRHSRHLSASGNPSYPAPTASSPTQSLTSFLRSWLNAYILPYLPEDLAAIARDPPDLSRPETLVLVFRAIAPYTQFLLVLVVLYVVWAVVTGFVGYTYRFLRFCFRIGPVIAVIAWVMAASGQGGIDVLFEALKQYAGLAEPQPAGYPRGAPPRRTPGWETPNTNGYYSGGAGAGSGSGSARSRRRRASSGSSSGYESGGYWDARAARGGRAAPADAAPPFDLSGVVQGFVKQAVARAAGLDWLVGAGAPPPKEERRREDTRRR